MSSNKANLFKIKDGLISSVTTLECLQKGQSGDPTFKTHYLSYKIRQRFLIMIIINVIQWVHSMFITSTKVKIKLLYPGTNVSKISPRWHGRMT